jgi:hypothetical protein
MTSRNFRLAGRKTTTTSSLASNDSVDSSEGGGRNLQPTPPFERTSRRPLAETGTCSPRKHCPARLAMGTPCAQICENHVSDGCYRRSYLELETFAAGLAFRKPDSRGQSTAGAILSRSRAFLSRSSAKERESSARKKGTPSTPSTEPLQTLRKHAHCTYGYEGLG